MSERPGWCDLCMTFHPCQDMVDYCKTKAEQ